MAIVTIDNKEYDIDALPEQAKLHLLNIQFVDAELARLQAQVAVFQTARIAYGKALHEMLEQH
jgi:hypothetical protein